MPPATRTSAYVWFDTEYTDLDLDRARLLQVAAMVTDAHLNRLLPPEQDIVCYVRLPDDAAISPWAREHLADVVAACRTPRAIDTPRLDLMLAEWLDRAVGPRAEAKDARPVLAGNSIHADWFLVRKFLPEFLKRLHYRVLDVTTTKLLWQDWAGGAKFDKENAALVGEYLPGGRADVSGRPHDAYYDIQASVAELNFYRSRMSFRTESRGRPSP